MDIYDDSTGVFTWEAFAAFSSVALAHASRRKDPASLLIVGIDPLPAITAAPGLSLDATAVFLLASVLLRAVRGADMIGRYGPTSFIILAQDAPLSGAARLAERIHSAAPSSVSSPRGLVPLTLSIGIASMPQAGTTLPELQRHAEQAFSSACRDGGDGVRVGTERSAESSWGSSLAARRRDELARLMQAFERQEADGIVIRTQPGACSVCLDASRDILKPHLVPIPSLPLNGCQNPSGCRCLYSSPDRDPRRRPPEVPALIMGRFEVPKRLRNAAQFGGDSKKGGKADEMAEYLENFPLLPIQRPFALEPGEEAYLLRPATRARLYSSVDPALAPILQFPFEGPLRPWVKQVGKPEPLPKDSVLYQEEGTLVLTNWRLVFTRAGATASVLLVDVLDVEYGNGSIHCQIAGERWRTVYYLRDPLLCGLYLTKAIRDIALLEGA